MDYVKTIEKAADDFIDNIGTAQEWAVSVVEQASKAVNGIVPRTNLQLPVELPRLRDVAESAFRVRDRWLDNQREFTLKLLDAIAPPAHRTKKAA